MSGRMTERMSDSQFSLHERGEARRRGDLLREAKRARASESALSARVARLEEALKKVCAAIVADGAWTTAAALIDAALAEKTEIK